MRAIISGIPVILGTVGLWSAAGAADGDCYRLKYGAEVRSNWTLTVSGQTLIWLQSGETVILDIMGIRGRTAEDADGIEYLYSNPVDHILTLDGDVYELGCGNEDADRGPPLPPGGGTPGPDSKGEPQPVG